MSRGSSREAEVTETETKSMARVAECVLEKNANVYETND